MCLLIWYTPWYTCFWGCLPCRYILRNRFIYFRSVYHAGHPVAASTSPTIPPSSSMMHRQKLKNSSLSDPLLSHDILGQGFPHDWLCRRLVDGPKGAIWILFDQAFQILPYLRLLCRQNATLVIADDVLNDVASA